MFFELFDSLSVFHSAMLTVATERAFHITRLKLYRGEHGERGMEGVCRTQLTCSLSSSCSQQKAVPSNDYKHKKKKLIPGTRKFRTSNRIPFP